MLKKLRVLFAAIFFVAITLLFLDVSGVMKHWFGWMAKVQLVPAVLSVNLGVIILLALLTILFGRLYCSVICPMGVLQDIVSNIHKKFNKKHLYKYRKSCNVLRYVVLVVFVALLLAGIGGVAALIEPYSAFGRVASNLLAPIYAGVNNILAFFAERMDSYAFYPVDVWVKAGATFAVAIVTFVVIAYLSWRYGRLYCNTICPVGSFLGLISRYSIFKPVINTEKCNGCGLCAMKCKSECINSKEHKIDYSRCVVCFNCIENCTKGAISYSLRKGCSKSSCQAKGEDSPKDNSRRAFMQGIAMAVASAPLAAKAAGGRVVAELEDKKSYKRETPIAPPGSKSIANLNQHCTACQLCVQNCPNGVLKPATGEYGIEGFMQPTMSYDKGFCRANCNVCSTVCPNGAIAPIIIEEKASTRIGRAVINLENCVVNTDGVTCGNCSRHCPTKAIMMVRKDGKQIPTVDTEKCIGCGACEYVCPARPFSAIHVEGNEIHHVM